MPAGGPVAMVRPMKQFAPSKKTLVLSSVVLSLTVFGWAESVKIDLDQQKKAAPAKAATTPDKSVGSKVAEEKEGKIVGVPINRPNGTFLGLSIEGGGFKLAFYNKKKNPIAIDVARATARWNPTQKKGIERIVLLPTGDGKALANGKFVMPPRVFKVYLTLLSADEQALESYVVDYREIAEPASTEQ